METGTYCSIHYSICLLSITKESDLMWHCMAMLLRNIAHWMKSQINYDWMTENLLQFYCFSNAFLFVFVVQRVIQTRCDKKKVIIECFLMCQIKFVTDFAFKLFFLLEVCAKYKCGWYNKQQQQRLRPKRT